MPQQPEQELDRVDRLMHAGDPIAAESLDAHGIQEAMDGIGTAITAHPRRAPIRRRRRPVAHRRGLIVALAAMVVIGGAAAASQVLSTYTGHYAKGWQIKAGGPGEYLRMQAPNFCQAALKTSSDLPYPPGDSAWRPWVLITELQVPHVSSAGACASDNGATTVSTGAVHGFFAMSAFCAWVYAWRDAKAAHNPAAAERAAETIDVAPRWKAVIAEDPHPTAGPLHRTPHGLDGDKSIFGWFLPFRRAVLSGDTATVNELIASNYGTAGCSFFVPPARSHGGTVNPLPRSS